MLLTASPGFVNSTEGATYGSTVRDPIFIDGDVNFTPQNGVTSGSGTIDDPYVISGWTINTSTTNAIEIINARAYFVIRNVSITTSGAPEMSGILISYSENGTILDSHIYKCDAGVSLWACKNIEIKSCLIEGKAEQGYYKGVGVYAAHSYFVTIADSSISDCYYGIQFGYHYNTVNIRNNSLQRCVGSGVSMERVHGVNLEGNRFEQNDYSSIILAGANRARVSNNTIEGSRIGIVINDIYSDSQEESFVFGNRIANCTEIGIKMENAKYYKFYHNDFINNVIQVRATVIATWDNGYPSGGNYWSDHVAEDEFGGPSQNMNGADGICDIVRYVGGRQDSYPLFHPGSFRGSVVISSIPANITPGASSVTVEWNPMIHQDGINQILLFRGESEIPSTLTLVSTHYAENGSLYDTGLTNGVSYYYQLIGMSANGIESCSPVLIATPRTIPDSPLMVSIVEGKGNISFSWEPGFDGGSSILFYSVYRNGTLLGNVTSCNYLDTGLVAKVVYNYTVKANNIAGIGNASVMVLAAPYGVPSQPNNLQAEQLNGAVILSWDAPLDDGGRSIYHYIVYQDDVEVVHATGTSILIEGLVNGQSYPFSISAYNVAGEGIRSSSVSAIPFTVPYLPTGLTAIPSNANVTLNWTTPAFDGGRAIDYYIVYQDGVDVLHVASTYAWFEGLINGHTYEFAVSAYNQAGECALCDTVSVMPYTVPDAPTGLMIIDGNGNVTVNWTPAFDGGRPIDHYIVYQDGMDIGHVAGTTFFIEGLLNGQSYEFSVSAYNLAGEGALSGAVSGIPYTTPDAPTGLNAVPGNSNVTLSWAAPAYNGDRVIDYYIVYQDGVEISLVTSMSVLIEGLVNGQVYSFDVSAHNLAGEGPASPTALAIPFTVPDAPTGLTATNGNGKVLLNWAAPSFNGGRSIDYYIVYQDGVDVKHSNGISVVIEGLINGQSYEFSISAHNLAGGGALSVQVPAIPYMVPDAPTGLMAVPGNAMVSLNWAAPSFNGGRSIDYYIVYQDGVDVKHSNGISVVIEGLINGQSYEFSISAHNMAGIGPVATVSVMPNASVPNHPSDVFAEAGDGSISVGWSSPISDGGSPILNYTLYRSTNGDEWVWIVTIGETDRSYLDQDIVAGYNYTYRAVATNLIGTSVPSSPSNEVTAHYNLSIALNTDATSTSLGAIVRMFGRVTYSEYNLPVASISLSFAYSTSSGLTWTELPPVVTDGAGNYEIGWIPPATGVYMVRVSWAGNYLFPTAESFLNLAIDSSVANSVLSVQSNSQISNFVFNTVDRILSFSVSGESGTRGYVKIIVSKTLLENATAVNISLDGVNVNYTLSSTETSWIMIFEYHHSTHQVVANLSVFNENIIDDEPDDSADTNGLDDWGMYLLVIGLVIVAMVAVVVLVYRKKM